MRRFSKVSLVVPQHVRRSVTIARSAGLTNVTADNVSLNTYISPAPVHAEVRTTLERKLEKALVCEFILRDIAFILNKLKLTREHISVTTFGTEMISIRHLADSDVTKIISYDSSLTDRASVILP